LKRQALGCGKAPNATKEQTLAEQGGSGSNCTALSAALQIADLQEKVVGLKGDLADCREDLEQAEKEAGEGRVLIRHLRLQIRRQSVASAEI
jgi:hypothetical protein